MMFFLFLFLTFSRSEIGTDIGTVSMNHGTFKDAIEKLLIPNQDQPTDQTNNPLDSLFTLWILTDKLQDIIQCIIYTIKYS